ncbi:MAG: helix-turn-helix transcriptional regulator [Alphaproteobacteria bacterium]|nr:helix-turn-helix transcriptional regulator [Alphaproteobacteria bacterium]
MTEGEQRHDVAWSIDITIAIRVRNTRERLGYSQAELAEMIEIPLQEMIDLEIGKTHITAGRLYTIAKALGVPLDWFSDEAT